LQQAAPQQASSAEEPEMETRESVETPQPAPDSSATVSSPRVEIPPVPEVASAPPVVEPKSPEECQELRRNEQLAKLMDPVEREKMKEEQARSSQMIYAGAAEQLGISDAQAERLFELQAEFNLEKMQQALESGTTIYSYIGSDPQTNINPWIVSYEGYDVAEKWADFLHDRMVDMSLRNIAGAMATADVPLSGEQRQQFFDLQQEVQMRAAEEFRDEGGLAVMPSSTEEFLLQQKIYALRQEMVNEQLEERAATFLSDKQMQVLKTTNKRNLAGQKVMAEQIRANPDRFSLSFDKDENGCVTGMSTSTSSG
jgi:hypothetical protein